MVEPPPLAPSSAAVVIVAAGRGERAGASGGPKQYRSLGGRAILARTMDVFLSHPRIDTCIVVIHPDDHELYDAAVGHRSGRVQVVDGAATRQASTLRGLESLAQRPPQLVLVHDAVRPFVDHLVIDRTMAAARPGRGALPGVALADTLKRAGKDGIVEATVPREGLHAAQTPQTFVFEELLAAHRKAAEAGLHDFTDDASIAEWAGLTIALVEGAAGNVKLTYAHDIKAAEQRLREAAAGSFPDVRTGNGYDVHAFGAGTFVTLGGVEIAHDRGLVGHSDADVALHALTDALLATLGAGDIGTHFPPSDPQWKGAASRIFVAHAASIVRKAGGRIANADITLICEAPRIGPHRPAMVAAIASMLAIAPHRVSIKATTNETLGFVGRREGIAAIATASVVYPGGVPE
jgi:2-C-methyl-D-erythritol 4-phosphate cytidylyltransferase/2-C-methyl-D-erythritol 2,4-cyclodiphosphate synthase